MELEGIGVRVITGNGVIEELPKLVKEWNCKKGFLVADPNTYAAGEKVCTLLEQSGIAYCSFILAQEEPSPDEHTVGSVVMHFDATCDLIIGVGSGVINDTCKIVSSLTGRPYFIVATAPSMDGYASATSSMERDGLKVSLPSRCADVIIGDIDIMKEAPLQLMQAGLGDMLAKYVSICEWRIAHMITGEYYSEEIAQMVREARDRCVQNSQGLMRREDEAVKAVFEGLIICGQAMALAGLSRPASGVEHYFSHIWDMRALEWGDKASLHGLQCGVGTLLAVKLYEQIRSMVPDKEKAFRYVEAFDFGQWSQVLREFLGKGAETMIAQEAKEQKYSAKKHAERFRVIAEKWQEIVTVMEEELPSAKALEECLVQIGAPVTVQELGVDPASVVTTFQATKDIRDKYVLSRLAWDLGVLEDLKSL